MMNKMAQRFANGGTLKSYSLPDGVDKTGPFIFKMTTTAPTFAEMADDLLIVPLGVGGNAPQANPYTQDRRVWPIVEEDASNTHTETTIVLPDGYTTGNLPADLNMSNALQKYQRKLTKSTDGRTVTIVSDMTVQPGRIPAADFGTLKDFQASLVKTSNQKIVVKKAR
jgi:hypothetical protein